MGGDVSTVVVFDIYGIPPILVTGIRRPERGGILQFLQWGVGRRPLNPTPEMWVRCLTRSLGTEGELEFSIVGNTVTSTLSFRIQVGKPSDSSAGIVLEFCALGIQEVVVIFLLLHVGDSARRGGASGSRFHRRPTVLGEDDLLAISLGVDPCQVLLDEAPRSASGSGLGAEER